MRQDRTTGRDDRVVRRSVGERREQLTTDGEDNVQQRDECSHDPRDASAADQGTTPAGQPAEAAAHAPRIPGAPDQKKTIVSTESAASTKETRRRPRAR